MNRHRELGTRPHKDLAALFKPSVIAVVGASPDTSNYRGRAIANLKDFSGQVYAVNPSHRQILGRPCFASIDEVPELADLAIVMVPRQAVPQVLATCAAAGVKAAIVVSGGFAELDEQGALLQQEVKMLADETDMVIVGPNSNGILNLVDNIQMSPTGALRETTPRPGTIALISQSGGLALGSIFFRAQSEEEIGFSYVVSTGNESDLSIEELIEFCTLDPNTDAIAVVLEQLRSVPKFEKAAAQALRARKPILVLRMGKSQLGSHLALTHTGALVKSSELYSAFFSRTGVIEVDDYDELYLFADFLRRLARRESGGDGLAFVSISGGCLELAADHADANGLTLAPLSPNTAERLSTILPRYITVQNPVDLGALGVTNPSLYGSVVGELVRDPNVGIIVAVLTVESAYEMTLGSLEAVAAESDKPIVLVWAGGSPGDPRGMERLKRSTLPHFRTTSRAMRAIRAFLQYRGAADAGENRAAPDGSAPIARPQASAAGPMSEAASKRLLREAGFAITREYLVGEKGQLLKACREIGYPLAMKLQSPRVIHKSDCGFVRLGVETDSEAVAAYEQLLAGAATHGVESLEGVLVQEMRPGLELFMGLRQDEVFGTVITFGLGGTHVELTRDVVTWPAPITRTDAFAMFDRLRNGALLNGYRNSPAANLEAVADLLSRLSDFGLRSADWLLEADLNPVTCAASDGMPLIVDASLVVR